MSVDHVKLSMHKWHDEAYQFQIDFITQTGLPHSTKQFQFSYHQGDSETEIVDLFSLNHSFQAPFDGVTGAFSNRDVTLLDKILKKQLPRATDRTIFTVDMKGVGEGYLDPSIAQNEEKFCQAFTGKGSTHSKSAKKALDLLQNKIDYVYCEGTLKAHLLSQFSEQEAAYLNSRKGVVDYCMLTEVFMNAAKFGHHNHQIAANNFIHTVSKTAAAFQPHRLSTILYPPLYYKTSEKVAQLFSPVFYAQRSCEQDQITKLMLQVAL